MSYSVRGCVEGPWLVNGFFRGANYRPTEHKISYIPIYYNLSEKMFVNTHLSVDQWWDWGWVVLLLLFCFWINRNMKIWLNFRTLTVVNRVNTRLYCTLHLRKAAKNCPKMKKTSCNKRHAVSTPWQIHSLMMLIDKKTIKNAYNETTSDYIKKIRYILHRNTVSTYIYFRCENSIYTYMTMNPLGFFECRSIKDFYWKPTIWFTSLDLKRDENLSMDCILTLKVGLRVVLLSTASR